MKRSIWDYLFDSANVIFLGLLGLITLFPFWTLVISSFVDAQEFYSREIVMWPQRPNIQAYRFLLGAEWIWNGYRISTTVTVLATLYCMFLILTCAYPMTKDALPGRKAIHYYFLFTMYFSGGLVPTFILITNTFRMRDSMLTMIIINGLPIWHYLIMRNFIKNIPVDLRESAILDGASEFQVLWKIIIPLSMPAIATLTLFQAVSHWNNWMRAFLYINSDMKMPLPIILRRIALEEATRGQVSAYMDMMESYRRYTGGGYGEAPAEHAIKNATIAIVALPIMCLYPFFQKHFAKGVLVGSVKG